MKLNTFSHVQPKTTRVVGLIAPKNKTSTVPPSHFQFFLVPFRYCKTGSCVKHQQLAHNWKCDRHLRLINFSISVTKLKESLYLPDFFRAERERVGQGRSVYPICCLFLFYRLLQSNHQSVDQEGRPLFRHDHLQRSQKLLALQRQHMKLVDGCDVKIGINWRG